MCTCEVAYPCFLYPITFHIGLISILTQPSILDYHYVSGYFHTSSNIPNRTAFYTQLLFKSGGLLYPVTLPYRVAFYIGLALPIGSYLPYRVIFIHLGNSPSGVTLPYRVAYYNLSVRSCRANIVFDGAAFFRLSDLFYLDKLA